MSSTNDDHVPTATTNTRLMFAPQQTGVGPKGFQEIQSIWRRVYEMLDTNSTFIQGNYEYNGLMYVQIHSGLKMNITLYNIWGIIFYR